MRGAQVESALAPGMVTMKTFDPPLDALAGLELAGVRRVGKMLAIEAGELALLVHLMSAGRLQLYDKRASLRDRSSRLLIRLPGRARAAAARVRHPAARLGQADARRTSSTSDEAVATLGPDALPPPPLDELAADPRPAAPPAPAPARPAHDRRDRPLVGGRDPLDRAPVAVPARVRPRRARRSERLHAACGEVLGAALDHYEEVIGATVPDKLPMPLKVHRRQGEDCPRCGTRLEAIHFKDYVMSYCPEEQTGGRVLKDRRLSKLLR